MKSMKILLDEAEESWRSYVRRDFPLYQDTPVITTDIYDSSRDWKFETDLTSIFASIHNDEALQEKFTNIIPMYWHGEPEEIARNTLEYLLFHELYHPVESPFSVTGDSSDKKRIHQAIRRGLLKADPYLSPKEQIEKVRSADNTVTDFIVDNRFALDNKKNRYLRGDVIPVWDVLELEESSSSPNLFSITRYMYSVLYGPKSTYSFFEEKASEKGVNAAEQALGRLIKRDVHLPRKKNDPLGQYSDEQLAEYAQEIRKVFSGKDRYAGIERLMSVLGPYVEKDMPQGRKDLSGIPGEKPQDVLQDFFDDMMPQQQSEFTHELFESDYSPEMPHIDIYAMHEFYKRNHPSVNITGGKKTGETVTVGKREQWKVTKSTIITEDMVSRLNLRNIDKFQRNTRLPMLIKIGDHLYRVNEYELKKSDIRGIVYKEANIDVPDIVEFYLDSSGSMYKTIHDNGFNDGSRWDMLCNVLYGFADALDQASKIVKKECLMRVHNVADNQVDSKIAPVGKFLEEDIDLLKTLFNPFNGYNYENLNIISENDGLKRAYVVVTDGNLRLAGRTERESEKMMALAREPDNTVLLFEIGGTYSLGKAVMDDPNIHYYPVHDKDKMLSGGLNVLISK